jgi:hypothetical protein
MFKWWPTDIVCKSPHGQSRFLYDGQKTWSSMLFERALPFDFCSLIDLASLLLQLSINCEVFACDFCSFSLLGTEK